MVSEASGLWLQFALIPFQRFAAFFVGASKASIASTFLRFSTYSLYERIAP
jgi:hypothetical protein